MGRAQETRSKKDVRTKKEKKRKDKLKKMIERKDNKKDGNSLDDMIAYVDENGVITNTPPDPLKKKVIIAENIELGSPSRNSSDFIEKEDQ